VSTKSDQKKILEKILALPVGDLDLPLYGLSSDYEGKGLTKSEVLMIQLVERGCTGDLMAIREILDRLLGKPSQYINAEVKTTTYYDFLMELVHDEQKNKLPAPQKVIDVTPEPEPGADLLGDLG